MKVISLLIVNIYIPFQTYYSILNVQNVYTCNCFYAHPVNIWEPILYSADRLYLLLENVLIMA